MLGQRAGNRCGRNDRASGRVEAVENESGAAGRGGYLKEIAGAILYPVRKVRTLAEDQDRITASLSDEDAGVAVSYRYTFRLRAAKLARGS